ncbi:MAG: flavodoxin-dependent (E)-4-hydroxy-3-methylbut-2-enyl-diphosphate synthase [candidate division WOR-3 bacterium]|nr:flavodoxin-dependent (E)-4-hydroxy-3-methylbut-2-enyl-diphosphate synthase [candidate division WOR-3 bacterium]MCX7836977.1 flavodoxin-dependent (E)-4-hydroxy-3-methylbut-2-enyl-diphosphate synthase [candidate division WOR-3 bacterium]MDW8114105.1 flavodoxin-dependent (E)-4-hydroxy-3-methylbut-2-enyl-diphosphate synthase [candidate division WOR-3 bacterium]
MRNKRIVKIGDLKIGGKEKILVQSMTKCKTEDYPSLVKELKKLEKVGCEICRIAIKTDKAIENLKRIKEEKIIKMPIVADVHFDYNLAIKAIKAGADKIRINPFNIKKEKEWREIIKVAKDFNIPIRIGLNAGGIKERKKDIEKIILNKLRETVNFFENEEFYDIVISAKISEPLSLIGIYEEIDKNYNYPLHVGLTETGLPFEGGIRSGVAMGILLYKGIGDTIRVSLTGDSVLEVIAGFEILSSLRLREDLPIIISCPTCGRCEVNLEKIVKEIKKEIFKANIKKRIKIAIMGCEVNGPGEASQADYGVAFGKKGGVIFAEGKIIKREPNETIIKKFIDLILKNRI